MIMKTMLYFKEANASSVGKKRFKGRQSIHNFLSFFFSTGSSALNAMSLVILEDIIKKRMKDLTDSNAARLCKIIGK